MGEVRQLTELELNIATNIKALLVKNKVSIQTLADYLGISYQKTSYFVRGHVATPITVIYQISCFFNVSINEITGLNQLSPLHKHILDKYESDKEFRTLINNNL